MAISYRLLLDQHLVDPSLRRLPSPARDEQHPTFRRVVLLPARRRGIGFLSVAAPLRRVVLGMRAAVRLEAHGQRASRLIPRADRWTSHGSGRPAVLYPLSHVRVLTREQAAAVHDAGGETRAIGLTVAPAVAPNGACGNP